MIETENFTAVCKLRWVSKLPSEQMTIANVEAMRLMMTAIILEQQDKFNEAEAAQRKAEMVLDRELRGYLAGIKHTPTTIDSGASNDDLGGYL